ncbi:transcriptional regulator, LysR family [Caenispirillum salinarum AK4]|uniref:Transcriptional regulator, LysR family n=1 Tax=Caenispirillum salinarum AK4 TaxID=1238182 RepID=K9GXM7_9PROT|nr:LysR substrate-binding domain-containing protein [Caenispirillum salinarum]EKV29529.1 transcriptional regulator, LysR family [Caenispirillum salinarum AK4]
MESGWLEDFVVLCETGNFSRAAAARNVTQPAFSRHIQALETWAGAPLFDRTRQPIRPTAAGRALLPVAEAVLRQLVRAREQVRTAAAGDSVTLHFAATHSLSLTFFPGWIRALEDAQHPFPIRLDSDTMLACEGLLTQGLCHFLLCHSDPAAPLRLNGQQFDSRKVGRDKLVPLARPQDQGDYPPLAEPGPSEGIPYLAYSDVSGLGRAVERCLAEATRRPPLRCRFTSHLSVVLRSMVLDGHGMAWLPLSLVAPDVEAGRLVPVLGEAWHIPLDVRVFRLRDPLGPDIEAFWARLTDTMDPAAGTEPLPVS